MFVKLNDINLYYEEHGQGKPIVLLHGLALDGSIWTEIVSMYADQARFIVPDLRGHGKTETGDVNGSLEQFANDLLTLVDLLQIENFTLVGHSMGGYISLVFAEKYPERLNGLVMVTSNARSDTPEKREARFAEAQLALVSGMHAISEPMAQKLTASVALRQQILPIIGNTNPRGFANVQQAIALRRNQLNLLDNLATPLLAIAGGDDQLMKPEVAQEMVQASRFGRGVVLPGIGHLPMLEDPLALGALIVCAL